MNTRPRMQREARLQVLWIMLKNDRHGRSICDIAGDVSTAEEAILLLAGALMLNIPVPPHTVQQLTSWGKFGSTAGGELCH